MSYHYSTDWFAISNLRNNFKIVLQNVNPANKISILEIGSHEGASTIYFAHDLLKNPESKLIAVDPFSSVDPKVKDVFTQYISKCPFSAQIVHKEMLSADFYSQNQDKFNFIYVDGSKEVDDIKIDFLNCLNIIEPSGIIWISNYVQPTPRDVPSHITPPSLVTFPPEKYVPIIMDSSGNLVVLENVGSLSNSVFLDNVDPPANLFDPSAILFDPSAILFDSSGNLIRTSTILFDPSGNLIDPSGNSIDLWGNLIDPSVNSVDPSANSVDIYKSETQTLIDDLFEQHKDQLKVVYKGNQIAFERL